MIQNLWAEIKSWGKLVQGVSPLDRAQPRPLDVSRLLTSAEAGGEVRARMSAVAPSDGSPAFTAFINTNRSCTMRLWNNYITLVLIRHPRARHPYHSILLTPHELSP